MDCENCGEAMRDGIQSWHFECAFCGLEASTLSAMDLAQGDAVVNEADREAGLRTLRQKGFEQTIDVLRRYKTSGKLLDVGCAHGWFLDAAEQAGFESTGVEPSVRVAQRGIELGHRVLTGYFPAALGTETGFDVISYNDVFEHIPDARKTMISSASLLAPGGVLSIAIPSSRGFFYRLSKLMARFGSPGPFERMWQKHFSSPHLYYFNERVLDAMASDAGLGLVFRGTLPSVRITGLWDRLSYDTTSTRFKNAVVYIGVLVAYPVLRLLPADIDLLMYKKP